MSICDNTTPRKATSDQNPNDIHTMIAKLREENQVLNARIAVLTKMRLEERMNNQLIEIYNRRSN